MNFDDCFIYKQNEDNINSFILNDLANGYNEVNIFSIGEERLIVT